MATVGTRSGKFDQQIGRVPIIEATLPLWMAIEILWNRYIVDLLSPLVSIILLPKSLMNCNDMGEKHPSVSTATGMMMCEGARFA